MLSISFFLFILTSCNNSENTTISDNETEQAGEYQVEKHDDIEVFIQDLAKAVNVDDQKTVAQMTHFPLQDEWGDYSDNQTPSLGCKTEQEFFEKYDAIFTKGIKTSISENNYRGWTDNGNGNDVIQQGEFLIEGDGNIDGESERPHVMLGMKMIDGKFKIYAIKFYS